MKEVLYIYGASGHGKVIADIARACCYSNLEFIDDGDNQYKNFGDISDKKNADFIIAIGNNQVRQKLQEKLSNLGLSIISLIHPSAIVSSSVRIGRGTVVMPNVVINANATIGDGVILNTSCIVEHDCEIGDYAHLSPNVALAGNVEIGANTHIGIGSSLIHGLQIGRNTIVGAGSVVVRSIGDYKKAYGNPCREIENII